MSCLFKSLAFFFKQLDDAEIRSKICSYLERNKPLIEGVDTREILKIETGSQSSSEYVHSMRRRSTWGGAIEIRAACNIWKVRIIVLNLRDRTRIEFLPISDTYRATLEISWTGNHYEPVRKYSL